MSVGKHSAEHSILGTLGKADKSSLRSFGTQSLAAVDRLLSKSLDLTPTVFYDPSASGSANTGTLANPYNTPASLASAVAAMAVNGVTNIVGFKRGATTTTPINLSRYFVADKPLKIVPYGSGADPLIDLGIVRSDWVVHAGAVYKRATLTTNTCPPVWQSGLRLEYVPVSGFTYSGTLAAKLAALNAAGAGFCVYDAGYVYIIPYANENPNLGQFIMSSSETAPVTFVVKNNNVTGYPDTGNVHIYGLAVSHGLANAINVTLDTTVGAWATPNPINNISVVGCTVNNNGVDQAASNGYGADIAAQIAGDSINIAGLTEATAITGVYVARNYSNDIGNNAFETAMTTGTVAEWNYSNDCRGHGLIEMWQSVKNCVARYNIAEWKTLSQNLVRQNCGNGFWVNAADSSNAISLTASANNSVYMNLAVGFGGQAFKDTGATASKVYNNTFITSDTPTTGANTFYSLGQASVTVNGSIPDISNNLFLNACAGATTIGFGETLNATMAPTGNNNCYFASVDRVGYYVGVAAFSPRGYFHIMGANKHPSEWKTAYGSMDQNSVWTDPQIIQKSGRPLAGSRITSMGVAIATPAITHDIERKPFTGNPIGCFA